MPHWHLSAILFADIAGYPLAMEANEPAAVAMVKTFARVLEDAVPRHDGIVLQYYGDGVNVASRIFGVFLYVLIF